MLTRRHIRVKVLQSIYALNQNEHPDLSKQEKFLFYSIDQMHDLYLLMLQLMIEMRDHAENYLEKLSLKNNHFSADNKLLKFIPNYLKFEKR